MNMTTIPNGSCTTITCENATVSIYNTERTYYIKVIQDLGNDAYFGPFAADRALSTAKRLWESADYNYVGVFETYAPALPCIEYMTHAFSRIHERQRIFSKITQAEAEYLEIHYSYSETAYFQKS